MENKKYRNFKIFVPAIILSFIVKIKIGKKFLKNLYLNRNYYVVKA